jgi:hypothetical protein
MDAAWFEIFASSFAAKGAIVQASQIREVAKASFGLQKNVVKVG